MKNKSDVRVLIVDDETIDITLLSRVFKKCVPDVALDTASNGTQALEYLDKNHPDLIVMDIRMPVMDGREALVNIKSSDTLRHIPVVMMSTSDNPSDIAFCYREYANAYVTKSFSRPVDGVDPLEQMIRFWLETSELPSGCG